MPRTAQLSLFAAPAPETHEPVLARHRQPSARQRVSAGDVWQLGRHRVLCGDATQAADVAALMAGATAALLVADPPYGMGLDTSFKNSRMNLRKHIGASRGYARIIGDDRPYDPRPIMALFHCREQFWWGADYYRARLPDGGSWIVWDKRAGIEQLRWHSAEFELMWSRQPHQRAMLRVRWFGLCGTETQDIRKRVHPTQKPLEVYEPIITAYSKPGALVVDPYLGSGTTLIACERTQRTCYGVEIEPAYCDVILARWEHATGQHAALVSRQEVSA